MTKAIRKASAVFMLMLLSSSLQGQELSQAYIADEPDDVRLSPDGKYVVAVTRGATPGSSRNLLTMRLSDGFAKAITGYTGTDVRSFFWANDERLIFGVDRKSEDAGAPEYRGSYTILRDGTGGRKLLERRLRRRSPEQLISGSPPQLLHRLPTDWKSVLVSSITAASAFPEVYLLDVDSGRLKRVVANEHSISRWITDNAGIVRAAIDKGDDVLDGRQRLWYRDLPDQVWDIATTYSENELSVLAFHAGNRRLIVTARTAHGFKALRYMSPTGELGEVILFDPVYDIGDLSGGAVGLKQTDQGRVVYYQYMADAITTVYFDPRWEARQVIIDEALADTTNTVIDWSDDERRLLVVARGDDSPGDYYLFETTEQKLKFIQPPAQWVKAKR
ncbi:MAG: hypothetical protein OER80_09425 [Gammaproteobacteria bacterium]|nr:hypothetical protein [Gammaproteobacteria bacterium]